MSDQLQDHILCHASSTMNTYRGLASGASSKATPSTLCQKCLKRGHYSYECKTGAQERPYVPRPSRTQQLLNPKLVPKLASDVPQELLRRKGIADEQLAQREQERSRKRDREDDAPDLLETKRPRSISSDSSVSVSTISTSASGSPSRKTADNLGRHRTDRSPHSPHSERRKRTRVSYSSTESDRDAEEFGREERTSSRNTRRKMRETSPHQRGRRRTRSRSGSRDQSFDVSTQGPPYDSTSRDPRPASIEEGSSKRRTRNNEADYRGDRGQENTRSRYSGDDDQITRKHYGERVGRNLQARAPPRERSLSPFSKRLALTQAMNLGR